MTPDRIKKSVWMNSHLSIAREYGGCKINGDFYVIDPATKDLVKQLPKTRKRTPNKQAHK